ncbi:prolyl oligopeptidase family serine peptidase [Stenomitos frigidus]|uniref:Acyl-peptide hydrolase n=1 Tax=Stenomitos frigidus ULC18 TaxID=2107698 RepID=A0A2T1DWY2_9CYAN|nr:prolyl oligopeptidase family serine peptidase [Stenomitos frigidus]PSB24990.1 S9 family peptidase [Stenomitos frigidus ULC18]
MLKQPDLNHDALWKQRFRAHKVLWAQLAVAAPQRGLVCTNASGVNQLYAWEVATNQLTPLTTHPEGKSRGWIAADGRYVYYLEDQQGNERGHYVRVPFEGGAPQDITPALPTYASTSLSENRTGTLLGLIAADETGFQLYLLEQLENDVLSSPRLLWRSPALCSGVTFSADGAIVVVATTARTGSRAFSLMAWETASGTLINELHENDTSFSLVCFSPQVGDQRLLATSDHSGFNRPLLWQPRNGESVALPLATVQGELDVWDWSADGAQLLLCEARQACYRLSTYSLATLQEQPLPLLQGTFGSGQFTASGEVLVTFSSTEQPLHLIALNTATKETRMVLSAGVAPPTRPWQSVTFSAFDGVALQAWLALPEGEAPFPTILHAHGGPTSVTTAAFAPSCQAWLDHGFAWLSVNYRGSTTFGRDFERAIWGQLGNLEVEDLVAAQHWLVEQGIAQAEAIFLTGGSYGGYLTLQTLGKAPALWAGGMADVAIADWFLMYEDQAETMRGVQRSLFGGTPEEKPAAHRAASPLTYADQVTAPILVIQGRHDTRCPARQMQVYEAKLRSLGKTINVHWFDAGHVMGNDEQSIRDQETKLCFAYQVLQQQSPSSPTSSSGGDQEPTSQQ